MVDDDDNDDNDCRSPGRSDDKEKKKQTMASTPKTYLQTDSVSKDHELIIKEYGSVTFYASVQQTIGLFAFSVVG